MMRVVRSTRNGNNNIYMLDPEETASLNDASFSSLPEYNTAPLTEWGHHQSSLLGAEPLYLREGRHDYESQHHQYHGGHHQQHDNESEASSCPEGLTSARNVPSSSLSTATASTADARLACGQCVSCGQQLFAPSASTCAPSSRPNRTPVLRRWFSKKRVHRPTPLTVKGRVQRGQCLVCSLTQPNHAGEHDSKPSATTTTRTNSTTNTDTATTTNTESSSSSTNCVYQGPFNDFGERHGQGIMTWNNGDVYKGNFWNGVRQGHGVLTFSDGSEYVGSWECNQMHGIGTRRFANGDIYMGEYVAGTRCGQGRFYFSNGDMYVGEWQNDHMNGFGRYYYACGQRFEGTFQQGKRDGKGKLQRTDGTLEVYQYCMDQRLGTGVRWSANRTKAWELLNNGRVKRKLTIAEAVSLVYSIENSVMGQM